MQQSRREINSSIAKRVMGKGRRVIVQDCESFMTIARSLTVSTKVVHIDGETINNFNDTSVSEHSSCKWHLENACVMFVDGHKMTKLWRNLLYQKNSWSWHLIPSMSGSTSITVSQEGPPNSLVASIDDKLKLLDMCRVTKVDWVIVAYDNLGILGYYYRSHQSKSQGSLFAKPIWSSGTQKIGEREPCCLLWQIIPHGYNTQCYASRWDQQKGMQNVLDLLISNLYLLPEKLFWFQKISCKALYLFFYSDLSRSYTKVSLGDFIRNWRIV